MNIDYERVVFMNTYYEAFVKAILENLSTVVGVVLGSAYLHLPLSYGSVSLS